MEIIKKTEFNYCNFCGKDGHNWDGCFKCISYPDWWLGKGKQSKPKVAFIDGEPNPTLRLNEEQYNQFATFFENQNKNSSVTDMSCKINRKRKWIVDLGATEHFTYENSLLEKLPTKRFESPVVKPNGDTISI